MFAELASGGRNEFELLWSRSFPDSSRQDGGTKQLGSYSIGHGGLLWHESRDQTVPQ